jgi:hypothetical protein
MQALYQIVDSERPYIWTRQAEAHELAQHLYLHPFWSGSVHPLLPESDSADGIPPSRDGILESADRVYLPPGIPRGLLVPLQSIVDGWVTNKGDA